MASAALDEADGPTSNSHPTQGPSVQTTSQTCGFWQELRDCCPIPALDVPAFDDAASDAAVWTIDAPDDPQLAAPSMTIGSLAP